MLDEPAESAKKIKSATTDSDGEVRYDVASKPGVSNLLTIYSVLSGRTIESIETEYAGSGYGDFKKGLSEVVVETFAPIRARTLELLDDPAELDRILARGAERASVIAGATMSRVRDAVGLLPASE